VSINPLNKVIVKDLSIVIVNYRCWEKLSACLGSLDKMTGTSFRFEVIVVDNDSGDSKLPEFRILYPRFSFIPNFGNYGFANGCNLGSTIANGKYLLFLNPDTIVTEKALSSMLDQARVSKANSIVSCRQFTENGKEDKPYGVFPSPLSMTGWSRALAKLFKVNFTPAQNDRFLYPEWVSGSVIMISKSSFNRIGGWNERFWMYSEDIDFCHRAREAGGQIYLLKNTSVIHSHGGSSRSSIEISALTKTEVSISKHEYVSIHEKGFRQLFMQTFLVLNNLLSGLLPAFLGLIFFFNKKLAISTLIYGRVAQYYINALIQDTWMSPRSVKYQFTKQSINVPERKLMPAFRSKDHRA
jgi:GT2 family glycosyltransferase